MRRFALLCALCAALAPFGTAQDLGKLVPADAAVVVHVPSFQALSAKASALGKMLGQEEEVAQALMMARMPLGPLGQMMDPAQPMIIALTLPADPQAEPMPTMIIPVTDPAKAGEMGLSVHGKYAVMSQVPGYAPGETTAPILSGIPSGDVVVRLDVSKVWSLAQPMVEAGMAEMIVEQMAEGMAEGLSSSGLDLDADEIAKGIVDGAIEFISSTETYDLVLSLDGGRLALDNNMAFKPASKLAKSLTLNPGLSNYAAMLPGDSSMVMLLAADWAGLSKQMMGFMDMAMKDMPEEMRDMVAASMKQSLETYKYMGRNMAFGASFGQGGISGVALAEAKDPAAYMKASMDGIKALEDMEGMPSIKVEDGGKIGDVAVTNMSMSMKDMPDGEMVDMMMKQVFGPKGLNISYATLGNTIISTVGGSGTMKGAIERSKSGKGKLPACLAPVMKKAGQTPVFVGALDLMPAVRWGLGMAEGMMGMPMPEEVTKGLSKIQSAEVAGYAAPAKNSYRFGLSVDVASLAKAIEILQALN